MVLILLFIFPPCKPCHFFFSSPSPSISRSIKVSDLERPLVSDYVNQVHNQSNELTRNYEEEGSRHQIEGYFSSPQTHGIVYKHKLPPASSHQTQGGSVTLDVISDTSEDVLVGQTLKPLLGTHLSFEDQRFGRNEDITQNLKFGNCLTLEVISGPSQGLSCSAQSTVSSSLPLTIGRVSPNDLILKDSEVSGKHALIDWNLIKRKWELVDMGSLNGTLLNTKPINRPDSGNRHWSDPTELANEDIITLGTISKLYVQITSEPQVKIPFGVGMASDPMALRRGGKKLPMEDVCYYQWPFSGVGQFGLFGICDGHGGAGAATSASKILPEIVASILSDTIRRERVLSLCDASEVLKDAFSETEAGMNHQYEGCTATLLLVWADGCENFFAQCANVGDSACVMNVGGKQIKMTEDHRITSYSERLRIGETGKPLKDGEKRLCGLNLARMLGDKFLKQHDARFSSEPYISQVVHIDQASKAFALMASDGLWDVLSMKKALQLVLETQERDSTERENPAEKIAKFLLNEARTLRTKDNTSVIFLDFNISAGISCKVDS